MRKFKVSLSTHQTKTFSPLLSRISGDISCSSLLEELLAIAVSCFSVNVSTFTAAVLCASSYMYVRAETKEGEKVYSFFNLFSCHFLAALSSECIGEGGGD